MENAPRLFHALKPGRRIWAVSFVYGQNQRLLAIHKAIAAEYQPGDQLVYLGNYLGYRTDGAAALDDMLLFRRALLASSGAEYDDIVYLKGRQEEYWRRFLRLQLEPSPRDAYHAMVNDGLAGTIASYGGNPEAGADVIHDGASSVAKWVGEILNAQKSHPGHYGLMTEHLRYGAREGSNLAIVSSGMDPDRPLDAQKESLWAKRNGPAPAHPDFRILISGENPAAPSGLSLADNGVITLNGTPDSLSAVLLDEQCMPIRIVET